MKALILNSGLGSRMGVLTSEHPKCMTEIAGQETILSRQLRMLSERGIAEIIMTTGFFDSVLVNYCHSLELPLHFTFINNPLYSETNYIYSIYCARDFLKDDDLLFMHGDLVFEDSVLDEVIFLDTIPVRPEMNCAKIKYLSVAEMFAEAIERIYEEISVSKLFN